MAMLLPIVFADVKLLSRSRIVCVKFQDRGSRSGVEDCVIKTLGRWESSAYLQYVRLSRDQLVGISDILAAP